MICNNGKYISIIYSDSFSIFLKLDFFNFFLFRYDKKQKIKANKNGDYLVQMKPLIFNHYLLFKDIHETMPVTHSSQSSEQPVKELEIPPVEIIDTTITLNTGKTNVNL